MKIKIIVLLTVYIFINSCSSDNRIMKYFTNDAGKDSLAALPVFYGYWLSESYLQDLEKTKSTKAAQELGHDHLIRIYGDSLIMKLSLHEGDTENKLNFKSPTEADIVNPTTFEIYNHIKFSNNKLILDGESYTKIEEENSRPKFYDMINAKTISGNYLMNGKKIEFMDNGNVNGLDSVISYKLNLDYADAGMQYDKIYLKIKNQKEQQAFIYEWKDKTLSIININCLEKEDKDDWCSVIEKGTVLYVMEQE